MCAIGTPPYDRIGTAIMAVIQNCRLNFSPSVPYRGTFPEVSEIALVVARLNSLKSESIRVEGVERASLRSAGYKPDAWVLELICVSTQDAVALFD